MRGAPLSTESALINTSSAARAVRTPPRCGEGGGRERRRSIFPGRPVALARGGNPSPARSWPIITDNNVDADDDDDDDVSSTANLRPAAVCRRASFFFSSFGRENGVFLFLPSPYAGRDESSRGTVGNPRPFASEFCSVGGARGRRSYGGGTDRLERFDDDAWSAGFANTVVGGAPEHYSFLIFIFLFFFYTVVARDLSASISSGV